MDTKRTDDREDTGVYTQQSLLSIGLAFHFLQWQTGGSGHPTLDLLQHLSKYGKLLYSISYPIESELN